jgi:hexosaminidase
VSPYALLFVLATPVWAATALIPAPRSVRLETGELAVPRSFPARVLPDTPANRLALETLREDGLDVRLRKTSRGALLTARVVAGKPESYTLRVDAKGIEIAGGDEAGLYYGVQTLRQLIRAGKVPYLAIEDAPALRYRGLSIDISRGPVLTEKQLESVVRTLASFKMNMLTLYMEHVFPYTHTPLVAPPGTGITPESMRRLSAYAARHHIDLVPQQQTFGHLHHMLKHELYNDMAETPYGSVLAAEEQRGYDWIGKAARQLADAFASPFLHIGSDETVELGRGKTKALVDRVGAGEAYMMHMRRVTEMLAPLNRKLMFWGDIALSHPDLMPKLPKSLVAMTWTYDPKPDYVSYIAPFRKNGMDVFVCPGLNNWFRIYPSIDDAIANINTFVRDGKELGAIGMLNTHWVDEGEPLFNLNWYGVVFSAAAAWQEGTVDEKAFARSFDWSFHRAGGTVVAGVIGRFARVHALLKEAGLRYASDSLFWTDPFTRLGAHNIKAMLPIAAEIRTLAEENLVDLAAAERDIPAHRDTLRYLALASHRLDYLGMKVLYSRAIAERYRSALGRKEDARAARGDLRRITGTNGYVEDLRESILRIRELYKEAWLAENQPHWIDNVLVRYDAEALYWQQKSNLIARLLQEFLLTKEIPPPEQLGLVLPE